jgi:V-type H+-transporting ATPase subunit d
VEGVKGAVDCYAEYHGFFDMSTGEKSLEDKFFEHEVFLNKRGFMQQFGHGVFYCWLKLKEQEIRNIVWIAEVRRRWLIGIVYKFGEKGSDRELYTDLLE